MKFGGTSVENAKAIDRVAASSNGGCRRKPVRRGQRHGEGHRHAAGHGRAAGRGERRSALKICRSLRERHYLTAGELLGTGLHTDLHNDLGAEFDSLDELLRGISAVGELTPRTSDYVVSPSASGCPA